MNEGKVRWFNSRRGYGFITDSHGKDVFVHYTGVKMDGFKELQEGQLVEFDVADTDKGKQAINVLVVTEISTNNKE